MSDYLKDNFAMAGLNDALNDEEPKRPVESQPMKLDGLVGMPADVLESLPFKVRRRVQYLRAMQSHYNALEARYYEERLALEAKYLKIYQPFYARRSDIVNGMIEVDGTLYPDDQNDDPIGIPEFWLVALKNSDVLAELITEQDEEVLVYLSDIKWYRIQDPKGFTIEFIFDENPYFKNTVLTKIYYVVDEDEPCLDKAIGTEIEWYPGKCLTQNGQKKKPKKGSKPVTKPKESGSFFDFFTPPVIPADDIPLNEETTVELQDSMEEDYEIAITIRDKIIPHAVSWFTGEAVTGYGFGTFLGDDSDISLDDDTDDDDEDKFEDVEDTDKLDGGDAQ